MRHRIQTKIIDPDSVLTDVDVHQIENMIWLELAPIRRDVERVMFLIIRLDHEQFGCEHIVQIATKLNSQKVVESCTTRVSKGSALVSSIVDMKRLVERRLRFESSWFYRCICSILLTLDWFAGNLGEEARHGETPMRNRLDSLSLASTKHTSNVQEPST